MLAVQAVHQEEGQRQLELPSLVSELRMVRFASLSSPNFLWAIISFFTSQTKTELPSKVTFEGFFSLENLKKTHEAMLGKWTSLDSCDDIGSNPLYTGRQLVVKTPEDAHLIRRAME